MRKWMGMFVVAVMAVSLVGCSGTSQPSGSSSSGELQPSATLIGPQSGKPHVLIQENRTVYQNLRYVPRVLSEETVERLRAALVGDEGDMFEYKENAGAAGLCSVFYRAAVRPDTATMLTTEEEARAFAADFLKEMGLTPENDYVIWSWIDKDHPVIGTISYYPVYKDVTVCHAGKIDFTIADGKITDFSYRWASVEGSDEPYDEAELISAQEAIIEFENRFPIAEKSGCIQRLYWMNPEDGVIHPGWYFYRSHPMDNGPIIDAVTGYYSG